MGFIYIPDGPDKNCDHETAFVTDTHTDPPTSRAYVTIFCPKCQGSWEERAKGSKYKEKVNEKPAVEVKQNNDDEKGQTMDAFQYAGYVRVCAMELQGELNGVLPIKTHTVTVSRASIRSRADWVSHFNPVFCHPDDKDCEYLEDFKHPHRELQ
jgi:hypothetical protein